MATIEDVVRSAERHEADVQRLLDDAGFQGLIRSVERHAAVAQAAVDALAAVQAGTERTRRFADICIELKWPPPWHMPSRVIDRITAAYHAGQLTPEETADIFASFYTPERIGEFGQRWAGYGWLSHRLPILQEALGNHVAGRHYNSTPPGGRMYRHHHAARS
jgi:hypothetical protein